MSSCRRSWLDWLCPRLGLLSWWSYSERRFETHHRQHQDESVGDCTDTTDRSLVLSQEAITGVYNATMTIQSISKGWLCQHPVLGTHKCATCFQSYEFLPPSFQNLQRLKKKKIKKNIYIYTQEKLYIIFGNKELS